MGPRRLHTKILNLLRDQLQDCRVFGHYSAEEGFLPVTGARPESSLKRPYLGVLTYLFSHSSRYFATGGVSAVNYWVSLDCHAAGFGHINCKVNCKKSDIEVTALNTIRDIKRYNI